MSIIIHHRSRWTKLGKDSRAGALPTPIPSEVVVLDPVPVQVCINFVQIVIES
jgi:hypothetical protein